MKKFIDLAGPALNFIEIAAYERGADVLLVAEDARKGDRAVMRPNGTAAATIINREEWDERPTDPYDNLVTLRWAYRQVGLPWPGDEDD